MAIATTRLPYELYIEMRIMLASWELNQMRLTKIEIFFFYIWSHSLSNILRREWRRRRKNMYKKLHYNKICLNEGKVLSIHDVCQVLITYIFHSHQNSKTAFHLIVITKCDLTTGVVRCFIYITYLSYSCSFFKVFFLLSLNNSFAFFSFLYFLLHSTYSFWVMLMIFVGALEIESWAP